MDQESKDFLKKVAAEATIDQLLGDLHKIAIVLHGFHSALIDQGFGESEAMILTAQMYQHILEQTRKGQG